MDEDYSYTSADLSGKPRTWGKLISTHNKNGQ